MPDDVLLNKSDIIERCLARIVETYDARGQSLETDYTVQDVIVLNIQRACEASIDIAMHLVRKRGLGLPQESRDAFRLLEQADIIDPTLSAAMQSMVGFRNIAVHDYRTLDMSVVRGIVERRLGDFRGLVRAAIAASGAP